MVDTSVMTLKESRTGQYGVTVNVMEGSWWVTVQASNSFERRWLAYEVFGVQEAPNLSGDKETKCATEFLLALCPKVPIQPEGCPFQDALQGSGTLRADTPQVPIASAPNDHPADLQAVSYF